MHHHTWFLSSIIAILMAPWVAAHLPAQPASGSASSLLATFDRDGDQKISKSEAPDRLKQNFTVVDRNSDGGIDLAELRAVLKSAANQTGQDGTAPRNVGSTESGLIAARPSFGTFNPWQAMRMRALPPDKDRPFYMLNLIKYRKRAVYRDGRETTLTGQQANALYSPIEFLSEIGAEVAYVAAVEAQLEGSQPQWESVAVVRYPSRAKFLKMITNKEFQARSIHKDAGVELTQVVVTEPRPGAASASSPATTPANEASDPASASDQESPLTLCVLLKYHDVAQYSEGHDEPQRSGREAMDIYQEAAFRVLSDVGGRLILQLDVEGVLIGDGRRWSEARLIQFPNERSLREAAEHARLQEVRHHRTAAIEDSYLLQLNTQIDRTAQIDGNETP